MKKALITGITGQDGSYLAELLLFKGYAVHGLIRRSSTFNMGRIKHLLQNPQNPKRLLFLHYGDLVDPMQIMNIIYNIKPDEVYNLASQSHVGVSFDTPEYTSNITALGTTRILETIRKSGMGIRFYQASSSEIFGDSPSPQNEDTPFRPRSPYAVSKAYAHWMVRNYRDGYDMFACNGILFNHESPRRGETFVTRKITQGIAQIVAKKEKMIYLGNLDAKRDWGYAPEYVETMWQILQQDKPDDFVIGTGENHTIREFLQEAFDYVGMDWEKHVQMDSKFFRPTEVRDLRVDASKANQQLGWTPKISFKELVRIMVDCDLEAIGLDSPSDGKRIMREKNPEWIKT